MSSNLNLQVESLQHLDELTRSSVAAKEKVAILELPKEPPGVYGVILADGTFEKHYAEPQPRDHKLLSVDQIPGMVADFGGREVSDGVETRNQEPSVWISPASVIVLEDDTAESLRNSKAVCPLRITPEFAFLKECSTRDNDLSQKDFIRKLRILLADALGEQLDSVVKIMRDIKFGSRAEGSGSVQRGKESYGKSIEAAVYSENGQIPEELVLSVRVFDDPALKVRYPLRVALEIDTSANTFSLLPSQQAITNLLDEALGGIRELLGKIDCPVYYGIP